MDHDTRCGTILLVGAGVAENSWAPVREALLTRFRSLPQGSENAAFAEVITELRHLALVSAAGPAVTGAREAQIISEQLARALKRYDELRRDIAERLTAATSAGVIRPRASLAAIKSRWLDPGGDFRVITTNWDLSLHGTFDASRVYHLHGDTRDHRTLYLPLEQSWEPYRVFDPTPGSRPREYGALTHGNWLVTRVERLVICGLSISPLDAELSLLLRSMADRRRISEVVIVDLDAALVANRLRFHTRDAVDDVTLFHPNELAQG